jgi:regulator of sigma E protease
MGLKAGDSIVAVNNTPVVFYDEFEKIKRSSAGKPISLTVVRNAQTVILNGKVPDTKLLGFSPKSYTDFFTLDKITYNPVTAIGKGFTNTVDEIANYGRQLKLIFTSSEVKASESVGGIGSFAKMFPSVFDWQLFLKLLAFVSIILAVMNLLPIPGLDGGYVVFLLYEMITGRQVNEKVMEVATTIGLVLLLALMVYANGLDVYRWIAN